MDKLPSALVIVLNWNGRSLLNACLSALSNLDYARCTLLMVDNASTDDSVDFVRHEYPHVAVLQADKNLGYAAGNNLGLADLSADYAVLVNPDIVVARDWLSQLISPMHDDKTIGIAGCKLHYPGGRIIQHAGGTITRPLAMPIHYGVHETDIGQYDSLRDVDYVTGAAIAISRPALEKIGPLDEGYFMYFEEADWCARARTAGYRVVFNPHSSAIHDESAIAVKGSRSYLQRFHTSRWRFLLKHFSPTEIVDTTIAAEESWLAGRKIAERLTLKRVYRRISNSLDEILSTWAASGGSEIDAGQHSELAAGLIQLRKASIEFPMDYADANRLAQKAHVVQKPIRSQTPLLGPLLASLRTLWARIAAKEQARSFATQQNEINPILLNRLREMETHFKTVELQLMQHDEKQVEIRRHQSEMRAELSYAYHLIKSIEARLGQIEEQSH